MFDLLCCKLVFQFCLWITINLGLWGWLCNVDKLDNNRLIHLIYSFSLLQSFFKRWIALQFTNDSSLVWGSLCFYYKLYQFIKSVLFKNCVLILYLYKLFCFPRWGKCHRMVTKGVVDILNLFKISSWLKLSSISNYKV